ncbi:MoaD/ThiS family protein [Crocinitomicaceae bacterium]|nr:MoaD/ThiS family protein [Crocinitomicaceae bacterium]
MTVDVHYFGMISDRLGKSNEKHTFETSATQINLRTYFENRFPELKEMSFKIAINQEIKEVLHVNESIHEIALLPPFAGG